jgi:hypothetical protein
MLSTCQRCSSDWANTQVQFQVCACAHGQSCQVYHKPCWVSIANLGRQSENVRHPQTPCQRDQAEQADLSSLRLRDLFVALSIDRMVSALRCAKDDRERIVDTTGNKSIVSDAPVGLKHLSSASQPPEPLRARFKSVSTRW